MPLQLKIEQFEGPLDLLLSLITKHKIDIFDIPIAEICDEYTQYLDSMRELDMDIASEFIYMAAELMLIKSRMLLPRDEKDEDPRAMLVDALLEHQRAQQAAQFLRERSELYYDRFIKQPDELNEPYSREHDAALLVEAFKRVADRMLARPASPDTLITKMKSEHWYTVEEKMIYVMRRLYRKKKVLFDALFDSFHTRNELCAMFLALLEMIRAGRVSIQRIPDGKIFLSMSHRHAKHSTKKQEEPAYV